MEMASGFLHGQQEEMGSGGKMFRDSRLIQPLSPYRRSSSSTNPLPLASPEMQAERRPSWLLGVISGAGKLVSSVLGSERSGSSTSECSSAGSSDGEYDHSSDGHEDCSLSDDELKMRESEIETNVEPLSIVPANERKLIIQQLLMQETFTRDECDKMIKLIQSRVVDFPYFGIDDQTRNDIHETVTSKGPWHYLDQNRNLSRAPSYSPSDISVFSPEIYSHEAVSPKLRNKAVMEAKKWFEEKKLSPSPAYDQECGPCILNTDMNQYDFGSDGGSPIEIAISYMQSLPQWRSTSFNTHGFKTPPSSGKHSIHDMGKRLLSTSKGMKRAYHAIGSWNSKENHRTFLKAMGDERENSKLGCADSPKRKSVHETVRHSAETEQNGNNFQVKRQKLHGIKAAEVGHKMGKDISEVNVVQHKECSIVSTEVPKVAAWSINDSHALASVDRKHYGDSFHETEVAQLENVAPAARSILEDSGNRVKFQCNDSLHASIYSASKCAHRIADLETKVETAHIQKGASGTEKNMGINRYLAEANYTSSALGPMSNGDPTSTNASSIANATSRMPIEPAGPSRSKRRVKTVVSQKKWRG